MRPESVAHKLRSVTLAESRVVDYSEFMNEYPEFCFSLSLRQSPVTTLQKDPLRFNKAWKKIWKDNGQKIFLL